MLYTVLTFLQEKIKECVPNTFLGNYNAQAMPQIEDAGVLLSLVHVQENLQLKNNLPVINEKSSLGSGRLLSPMDLTIRLSATHASIFYEAGIKHLDVVLNYFQQNNVFEINLEGSYNFSIVIDFIEMKADEKEDITGTFFQSALFYRVRVTPFSQVIPFV